jgi:hypothetical protein
MPALALRAGDRTCRPGLALRRSTAAFDEPWRPASLWSRSRGFRRSGGFKERALDAVVRLEAPPRPPGITIASRDRRRRSPFALSFALQSAPQRMGISASYERGRSASIDTQEMQQRRGCNATRACPSCAESSAASRVNPTCVTRPGMTNCANRAGPPAASWLRLSVASRGMTFQHIALPQLRMDSTMYFRLLRPGWPMMAISPMT